MLKFLWTSHDHKSSVFPRRRHIWLDAWTAYLSKGSNPSCFWFSKHQVAVESQLFRKHAKLLKEDKVVRIFSNPKKADACPVIIVRHDRVYKSVGHCDSWLIGNYSNMLIRLQRSIFPLHFSIAVVLVLSLWTLHSHLLAFLSLYLNTFSSRRDVVNELAWFYFLRSRTKKSTIPGSSIRETGL